MIKQVYIKDCILKNAKPKRFNYTIEINGKKFKIELEGHKVKKIEDLC